MARVKVYMLRRALFSLKTHVSEDPERYVPFCGRKGSYRPVGQTATPLCKDCVDEFEKRHPRAGLFTHVAGLEADDATEARMDEMADENAILRRRLDVLERATGEVRPVPTADQAKRALGAQTRRPSQVRTGDPDIKDVTQVRGGRTSKP